MTFSVVVATFRRPLSLEKCLLGLEQQERVPDEVLVIVQDGDVETQSFLQQRLPWAAIRVVRLAEGGAVRQYNAGLNAATSEIVSFIDDDAIARPDWLTRIRQHFLSDPKLGGVGGRDVVFEHGHVLEGRAERVGVVQWFGRVVGNHHLEIVGLRQVQILKGVNMSFRRTAVGAARFDGKLRGRGAQTCCDMAFSFDIVRQGWRLIYDPSVIVDHFPAKRFDADQRGVPEDTAIADQAFNFYRTLRCHMAGSVNRRVALGWAFLIGTKSMPGMIRGFVSLLKKDQRGMRMRSIAKTSWQEAKDGC